ncbi:MAG: siderophore-interacting protein [Siphonobacter sp.]
MSFFDNIAKKLLKKAVLTEKCLIAEHTYHIRLAGDELLQLPYTPGEHMRIMITGKIPTSLSEKVRTYSVWQYDPEEGILDMAICTYSNGVGARWVQDIQVGEMVYFAGPRGNFTIDTTGDFYVFVGDVSSLAHFYELKRNLDSTKKIYSLMYAEQSADFFPDITNKKALAFYQLPLNPINVLREELASLLSPTQGKGIVYVGGDSRVCVDLNRFFRKELAWENKQVKTKPFWNPLKTGLE